LLFWCSPGCNGDILWLGWGVRGTLLTEQVAESWTPSSELEKAAVQQQLEKLLATPLFNSSKRYPSFLKFVVTRSLAGQTDQLKERILGVEIFGRAADYDTNTDPIVRVTAAEIRKRIEQYYQDPKHSQEIRLYLPAGSYAPQYSWPGRPAGLPASAIAVPGHAEGAAAIHPTNEAPPESRSGRSVRLGAKSAIALLLLLLAGTSSAIWFATRPPALKQFWEPFVKSSEPVLFCIADQIQYSTIRLRDAADP